MEDNVKRIVILGNSDMLQYKYIKKLLLLHSFQKRGKKLVKVKAKILKDKLNKINFQQDSYIARVFSFGLKTSGKPEEKIEMICVPPFFLNTIFSDVNIHVSLKTLEYHLKINKINAVALFVQLRNINMTSGEQTTFARCMYNFLQNISSYNKTVKDEDEENKKIVKTLIVNEEDSSIPRLKIDEDKTDEDKTDEDKKSTIVKETYVDLNDYLRSHLDEDIRSGQLALDSCNVNVDYYTRWKVKDKNLEKFCNIITI